ncbi:DoxX family protein [Vibrio sp. SM6]|uniref:DoxX family protein n=1 Tax=Vibrio agarilyticus TaxID=2726741 RepID=A0A7X8TU13_9VIBR|nr:DoxX family protein [Vibrio agarilyticus]NLS14790.1 DoxX family protein [Vibrio agarilyticus]
MPQEHRSWLQHYERLVCGLETFVAPALLLVCRLWVAVVFFTSGMTKINTWESTLYLFEYEYQVPLLSWELAAMLGTITELVVPCFIAIGLLTRPMACVLFIFNIIAVWSYPALWQTGFYDHQLWGLMLLIVVVWGPGILSVDHFVRQLMGRDKP